MSAVSTTSLRVKLWAIDKLVPYAANPRTHSKEQISEIAASIREFGWTNPILVDEKGVIIAGHARLMAAREMGLDQVPVVVLAHLTESQKRALVIADNKLALNSGWDDELLRSEILALQQDGFNLDVIGFSDEELRLLLPEDEDDDAANDEDIVVAPPADPVSRLGDLWRIGVHRLICGDCRDASTVERLLQGGRVHVAISSPPYASQRAYDPSSGFRPVPPDEYVGWFAAVARNIEAVLAPDGSYFLNIKAHADDGERSLYVMDLVLAHKRQWGWRFVDEFCWRNTANGVPGGWPNRFKNAWEPVFHFTRANEIKFRPFEVGHRSADVVVYARNNPVAPSGSGLLGCGADKVDGIARPSNVIEAKAEGGQGAHCAPSARALFEFFVKAFSDRGDIVFDPFMGSGTTMAAAQVLSRIGYGCEISPAYCDVIVRRLQALAECDVVLADTGQTFEEVAQARGVIMDAAA